MGSCSDRKDSYQLLMQSGKNSRLDLLCGACKQLPRMSLDIWFLNCILSCATTQIFGLTLSNRDNSKPAWTCSSVTCSRSPGVGRVVGLDGLQRSLPTLKIL